MLKLLCTSLLYLFLGSAATAAAPDTDDAARAAADMALVESLTPQQGKISLPGAIATLDLPPTFWYLNPDDSARLIQGWGNPPGVHTLGMIVPAGVNPMSAAVWGVVLTYDKDGHVKDDDADGIDYNKLLKDMQASTAEESAEREKQGYPATALTGWAEAPHYDKANHKLYWAQTLQSADRKTSTLNYNVRVLGREGVLILNAIADMRQLDRIKTEMQQVTTFTNFTSGNRYTDFDSHTDKVAKYGIAALVAGGVAAKLGLFAKLFAVLLAFKKLLIVGIAAAGSAIWKFFKRMPKAEPGIPVDLTKH